MQGVWADGAGSHAPAALALRGWYPRVVLRALDDLGDELCVGVAALAEADEPWPDELGSAVADVLRPYRDDFTDGELFAAVGFRAVHFGDGERLALQALLYVCCYMWHDTAPTPCAPCGHPRGPGLKPGAALLRDGCEGVASAHVLGRHGGYGVYHFTLAPLAEAAHRTRGERNRSESLLVLLCHVLTVLLAAWQGRREDGAAKPLLLPARLADLAPRFACHYEHAPLLADLAGSGNAAAMHLQEGLPRWASWLLDGLLDEAVPLSARTLSQPERSQVIGPRGRRAAAAARGGSADSAGSVEDPIDIG